MLTGCLRKELEDREYQESPTQEDIPYQLGNVAIMPTADEAEQMAAPRSSDMSDNMSTYEQ